jgi:2-oxoisovalerate ferredoxin oxidoreductase beta subunit
MGKPLRMAEMMADIDGPIYVERVALYDNKQRVRAHKAITKALRLQIENRGFGFVEVLSECPTHLHMTPADAEQWVKDEMTQVFPLGVKKDVETEPWFGLDVPNFEPDDVLQVIGGTKEPPERFGTGFPAHIDPEDISIKFAGAGGDGAQTAALLTTRAAINEGFDSTHIPAYGPESRGGTSYADVHVAVDEVLSTTSPNPHVLVVFNPQSLERFGPTVRPGGTILYDSSIITQPPTFDSGLTVTGLPFTQIAIDLGKVVVKNIVALGAMQAATQIFPEESFRAALRKMLANQCALLPINEEAFACGIRAFKEAAAPDAEERPAPAGEPGGA